MLTTDQAFSVGNDAAIEQATPVGRSAWPGPRAPSLAGGAPESPPGNPAPRVKAASENMTQPGGDLTPRAINIGISEFPTVYSLDKPSFNLGAWDALCERLTHDHPRAKSKIELPLLTLAKFGDERNVVKDGKLGSYRHDANVLGIYGVVVEHDAENVSIEEAARRLSVHKVAALLYSSPSHMRVTFDKEGREKSHGGPRWRVIVPTSRRTNAREHRGLVDRLNGALGGCLAPESWDLSRVYYYGEVDGGQYEVRRVRGRPIDELLNIPAISKPGAIESRDPPPTSEDRDAKIEALDEDTMRDIESAARYLVKKRGSDDYDEWIKIYGLPLASIKGTEFEARAQDLFHEVSSASSKYDRDETEAKWEGFNPSETTYLTLMKAARDAEWVPSNDCEDDLEDVSAAANDAHANPGRFHLIERGERLTRPRPRWRIKKVLPEKGTAMVFGQSGSGKSAAVLDLCGAIDQGTPWRGNRVMQGRVVYVAAEGADDFMNRMEAYERHYGCCLDIAVIADTPSILQPRDVKALAAQLKSRGVDVLVLDTLARVTAGGNENSAEAMGLALKHCEDLQRELECLIVIVHHSGKDESKGARGWSGIKAAVDTEIEVTRDDNRRELKITKLKNGEDGATYPFRLTQVVLGQDDDGDDITSIVVDPLEGVHAVKRREPKGKNEKLVWTVVNNLADLGDGPIATRDLLDGSKAKIPAPTQGERDRRLDAVRKAMLTLQDQGFIDVNDEEVTICHA